MNRHVPNILTITRFILAPIFYYFAIQPTLYGKVIALTIFLFASFTDFLDGKIARLYNIKSKFGIFADPLADKILVITALFSFTQVENLLIPLWLVGIIIIREVLITILRIRFIHRNKSLHTALLGKIKTSFQMLSILIILSLQIVTERFPLIRNAFKSEASFPIIKYLPLTLIIICTIITLISGIQYAKSISLLSKEDN